MFVAINICCDKRFVATKQTIFSQQNFCHRHTLVATKNVLRRDKKRENEIFAATKMILVATPANDKRVQLLSGKLLGK